MPGKKIKLATYASRCIENEILMYLRRNSKSRQDISLDEPLSTDWDGNELLLSDVLGSDDDDVYRAIEEDVDRELLRDALKKLTGREQRIMCLRFGLAGAGMPDAEGGRGYAGDFAELYFEVGKADSASIAA